MTEDQAVSMTLSRHPAIGAVQASVRAALLGRKAVSGMWQPQMEFDASYFFRGPLQTMKIRQQMDTPVGPMDMAFNQTLGSYHNVAATLKAGWRAWDWGIRILMGKAADSQVAMARQDVRKTRAQLAHATRGTFLALLLAKDLKKVAEFGLKQANRHLRDAKIRKVAGTGNGLEVAQASSVAASRKADLAGVDQQVARFRVALALLCGLDPKGSWYVTGDLKALANRSVPRSVERLLAHTPDMEKLRAAARATRTQATMLRRSRWPTVDLAAGVSLLYPKNFFEKEWGPAYQAGVVLTWRFWDGLTKTRQAEQADVQADRLDRMRAAAQTDVRLKVVDAVTSLRTASAKITAARKAVQAAEKYLTAAKTALAAGAGRSLDTVDAERAVVGAKARVLQALFDKAMARAQLLDALGIDQDLGSRSARSVPHVARREKRTGRK
ncbi:MAG: TolC family protein [Deltaproteobacteria bacterium]|nr:TolC family protein [Deltaproteobacteria bacterium]